MMRWILALALFAAAPVWAGSETIQASWGADVTSAGNKNPGDGDDGLARITDGTVVRSVNKFPTTNLPAGATLTQAQYQTVVFGVANMTGVTAQHGGYNGDGLVVPASIDPETDTGATAFSRCNTGSDNYGSGLTEYQTTGTKTVDLGSGGLADLKAAYGTRAVYAVASRFDSEATPGADILSQWREYIDATVANRPQLVVTYSWNEPTRVVSDPTRVVADPTRVVADPTRVVADPTRAP